MATINEDPRITAMLDLIAWSEGTQLHPLTKCNGYDVIVSGDDGMHTFTDFSTHPFQLGRPPIAITYTPKVTALMQVPKPVLIHSTASGRYQIILTTWNILASKLDLHTFSPMQQDLAAEHLLLNCRAIKALMNDDILAAIQAAAPIWASFPGGPYDQPTHAQTVMQAKYEDLLDNARAAVNLSNSTPAS